MQYFKMQSSRCWGFCWRKEIVAMEARLILFVIKVRKRPRKRVRRGYSRMHLGTVEQNRLGLFWGGGSLLCQMKFQMKTLLRQFKLGFGVCLNM